MPRRKTAAKPKLHDEKILLHLDDLLGTWDTPTALVEERIKNLVGFRLAILEKLAAPTEISAQDNCFYTGYIHSETALYLNYMLSPLRVDDPAAYELLLDLIAQVRLMRSWQGKPNEEIVEYALNYAISRYFGNHYATRAIEEANAEFYLKKTDGSERFVSVVELRGKCRATSIEKAALAQNLNLFLGRDTTLVISPNCRLSSHKTQLHAYNIVKRAGGQYQIFDPACPQLVYHNNGDIFSVLPAMYPISAEEYAELKSGGSVEVMHRDVDTESRVFNITKRIYAGPRRTDATVPDHADAQAEPGQ
jgi:hypothetical protein